METRYLVPEALEQGCDTLISIGGVQSNHTRQVAGVAAKLGLKVWNTHLSYQIVSYHVMWCDDIPLSITLQTSSTRY